MTVKTPSDAARRSTRTLIQGSVVTGVLALAGTTTALLTPDTELTPAFWAFFGLSAIQTVGTSVASYVQRKLEDRREVEVNGFGD